METKDKDFSKFRHEIVDSGLLAELSNAGLRVYVVILRHADYKEGWSRPTVKTISKKSGVNKNRIAGATRELVGRGLIEKKRAGKNFRFRNIYRILKHPRIDLDIVPEKTDKCKHSQRGVGGKFSPIPKNTDNELPQNTESHIPQKAESHTFPGDSDKKKNLERILFRDKNREKPGLARAFSKKPASPVSNSDKPLKAFSKEELQRFIQDVGLDRTKEYFRKKGCCENEIRTLDEIKGGLGERFDTIEGDKSQMP